MSIKGYRRHANAMQRVADRDNRASIATNDPDHDPTPRVALVRDVACGRHVWRVACSDEYIEVADGATPAAADRALERVYGATYWDLRFGA